MHTLEHVLHNFHQEAKVQVTQLAGLKAKSSGGELYIAYLTSCEHPDSLPWLFLDTESMTLSATPHVHRSARKPDTGGFFRFSESGGASLAR